MPNLPDLFLVNHDLTRLRSRRRTRLPAFAQEPRNPPLFKILVV